MLSEFWRSLFGWFLPQHNVLLCKIWTGLVSSLWWRLYKESWLPHGSGGCGVQMRVCQNRNEDLSEKRKRASLENVEKHTFYAKQDWKKGHIY